MCPFSSTNQSKPWPSESYSELFLGLVVPRERLITAIPSQLEHIKTESVGKIWTKWMIPPVAVPRVADPPPLNSL